MATQMVRDNDVLQENDFKEIYNKWIRNDVLTTKEKEIILYSQFYSQKNIKECGLDTSFIYCSKNFDSSISCKFAYMFYLMSCGQRVIGKNNNAQGNIAKRSVIQYLSQINGCRDWKEKDGNRRGLSWSYRLLLLDIKSPIVKQNVDFILLSTGVDDSTNIDIDLLLKQPECYLALGELKGGIDIGGLDEHYKVASEAFNRYKNEFTKYGIDVPLFLLVAKTNLPMRRRVKQELSNGKLSCFAHLTRDSEMFKFVSWIKQK